MAAPRGTLLLEAVKNGDLNRVRELLNNGEDIKTVDNYGETAVHIAAERGNKEMLEFLLMRGADIDAVNSRGETALILAMGALGGFKVEVIEELLKNKANPNIKDNFGNTALHFAVRGGPDMHFLEKGTQIKVIKALLEAGADVTVVNNNNDRPIDRAPDYAREEIEALDEFRSSKKNRP